VRVCIEKSTGKLIESQSGGESDRSFADVCNEENKATFLAECDVLEAMRLNTLKQNALNAGYKEDEIEVKWVTDEEWAAIQEASKTPEQKLAELNAPVKARLIELDLKSIRSIRERLAIQPDAPKFLIEHEAAAKAERAKLINP